MFFTNNFQGLQKIHSIIVFVLLVSYPVSFFLLDQGSIVAFTVIYLLCFIVPTWYTGRLIDRWCKGTPLISESAILHEVSLSASELQSEIDRLCRQQRWRVNKRVIEDNTHKFTLETPVSLRSLGETIGVVADFSKQCADTIAIRSTPKIPTTEVDDGRNRANVEAVRLFLSEALQAIG
ncbi:MAG: hypothetical protein WA960_21050 [Tunicatimonas sp.]